MSYSQNTLLDARMTNFVVIFTVALLTVVSCEKRFVLNSDQDIMTRFTAMETQINQLTNRLAQVEQENNRLKNTQVNTSVISFHLLELEMKNSQLETKNSQLENRLKQFEINNVHPSSINGGSVYIRWGETSCSTNGTSLVYKGYAGGSHAGNTGGGANTLCLPDDPTWNKYTYNGAASTVFGTEFDSANTHDIIGDYLNQDIPCALCQTARPMVVMIPGRTNCYPGWTQEYTGYMLAGYIDHPSNTDFICLDENPEAVPNGQADDDGHIMFLVKTKCGSLACPPYVDERLLACVVCSK